MSDCEKFESMLVCSDLEYEKEECEVLEEYEHESMDGEGSILVKEPVKEVSFEFYDGTFCTYIVFDGKRGSIKRVKTYLHRKVEQ